MSQCKIRNTTPGSSYKYHGAKSETPHRVLLQISRCKIRNTTPGPPTNITVQNQKHHPGSSSYKCHGVKSAAPPPSPPTNITVQNQKNHPRVLLQISRCKISTTTTGSSYKYIPLNVTFISPLYNVIQLCHSSV